MIGSGVSKIQETLSVLSGLQESEFPKLPLVKFHNGREEIITPVSFEASPALTLTLILTLNLILILNLNLTLILTLILTLTMS